LPGAPDLSSFNENLSAFLYNLKLKIIDQCGVCAATSVPIFGVVEFFHEKDLGGLISGFVSLQQ
jgi:hypothetical protein